MAGPDNPWSEDVAQTLSDEVTYGSHTIPWSWWTVWGVRPGTGGDTALWLYGDDAYTINTLAVSDQSTGDGVNFVVGGVLIGTYWELILQEMSERDARGDASIMKGRPF